MTGTPPGQRPRIGPPTPDTSAAIERFIEMITRYQCLSRGPAVSKCRVEQAVSNNIMSDCFIREELNHPMHLYTGSLCEGLPPSVCSDLDVMFWHHTFPLVLVEAPGGDDTHKSGYVIINGNSSQPAFVRLKVTDMAGVSEEIRDVTGEDGYVDGSALLQSYLSDMRQTGETDEINGPAITGLVSVTGSGQGMADQVLCFRCPYWPPCASRFLTRSRPYGWLSPDQIDQIQQYGCHVVPVGHPLSDNRDTEWRWSFSAAEKELIHTMEPHTFGAMYLLKAVKQEHYHIPTWADGRAPFCSYFIKTACLWVAEQAAPTGGTAITRLYSVCDWLIQCFQDNRLPHYFIPDQNLIGPLTVEVCDQVVRWLGLVKHDLWRLVLSSVATAEGLMPLVMDQVCEGVGAPPGIEYAARRALVSTLCVDTRAVRVLEEATAMLAPGSQLYRVWQRYHYRAQSSILFDPTVITALHVLVDSHNMKFSIAVQMPESILLPAIENINYVVLDGYGDMYTQALYRHMGDYYHVLYAKLSDVDTARSRTCMDKAVHYYTLGREMVHTDGWRDRGLGGYILLATLYYLSGQWGHLRFTLAVLNPLLTDANIDNIEDMSAHYSVCIHKNTEFFLEPWKSDPLLYHVMTENKDEFVFFHHVPLGYYINVREALRRHDLVGANAALSSLDKCKQIMIHRGYRSPVESMVSVLLEENPSLTRPTDLAV